MAGDLTSGFNFRTPNTGWKVSLPDTDDLKPVDLVRHPDQVPVPPADPKLPRQERGVRPARPIPYTLHADGNADGSSFSIEFGSTGQATRVFHVRSADPAQAPRSYTVEPGKQLADAWDATSGYDLSVHGPNGFFRRFKSGVGGARADLAIRARYGRRYEVMLEIENRGGQPASMVVSNRYSSQGTKVTLQPGGTSSERWPLGRTRGCTTWLSPSRATPRSSTVMPATSRTARPVSATRAWAACSDQPTGLLCRPWPSPGPARPTGPGRSARPSRAAAPATCCCSSGTAWALRDHHRPQLRGRRRRPPDHGPAPP